MTINNVTIPNVANTVATAGASTNPFVFVYRDRDPTVNDVQYPQQKIWLNTNTNMFWELKTFNTVGTGGQVQAIWIQLGSATSVETFTTDDGHVVPPTANNVNVFGDGVNISTTGNVATSTINIHLNGNIATTYVENTGSAVPSANILNVLGSGGISTTGAGNTITIDGSGVVANNLKFNVDAHTAPGTNPVVPDGTGHVTITGGQVAAGTTTNVIRTDSLAANTYTIEVQRSQAVASSTVGDNGVCHFDSHDFAVDSNGFVTLHTTGTPAFYAFLNTTVSNVTGDGTTYQVIFDTVTFDNLGNYNTGTGVFTAPRTGFYIFTSAVTLTGIGAGHNIGNLDLVYNSATNIHGNTGSPTAQASGGNLTWVATSVYHLASGDTFNVIVKVANSTKTVNVGGTSTFPGFQVTNFSGSFLF